VSLPQQILRQPPLDRSLRPNLEYRLCILRYRRVSRSTALDVAPMSFSSKNTNTFCMPGDNNFLSTSRNRPKRPNPTRKS
jgi:hypothetical protein